MLKLVVSGSMVDSFKIMRQGIFIQIYDWFSKLYIFKIFCTLANVCVLSDLVVSDTCITWCV